MTIDTASFDHPDPSILTVLTSPSDTPGAANADFVIVPPRWMVAEHSFPPPWFHRNVTNECMGLVHSVYDAEADGFVSRGLSLHACISAHRPDATTVERAIAADLPPRKTENALAFMFETRNLLRPARHALEIPELPSDYDACRQGLRRDFTGGPA